MIECFKKTVSKKDLTETEAYNCMEKMISGKASDIHIAAFLASLATKGETASEITGFVKAMRDACTPVNLSHDLNLVDTCGTGGDTLKTFNVSTAAAIIAAASGVYIGKHGNRAVTSSCGGADILEAAGVKINLDSEKVAKNIIETGIGFMFAPNFHPATKNVMPVRQKLGIRTVFNILGPLTSPVGAEIQLVGVFDSRYVKLIAEVLNNIGVKRAMVVHGMDVGENLGMDEISNVGPTLIAFVKDGNIDIKKLNPEDFGVKKTEMEYIKAPDTLKENLKIFLSVLRGKNESKEDRARLDIALANAGAIIYLSGKADNLIQGTEIARETVFSGRAIEKLLDFAESSKQ
ncbi:anthranilate phosphoribosyltransferase [Methanobacterium alcaliphilum]|uniref:anthranilate phosphoribosyltransferase n=1 Tax=Methanobacterium alcaliphilum TaxID=392018 RepID=UPI00200A7B51|nr:anthranilate phosphoribosyltransferase [Methanobacterium alcaliphilum]MCK9152625.1 anthranilate phosphoribosyltransferase [Methanobacterium alcaliphilum]